jgi:hypothetical protein
MDTDRDEKIRRRAHQLWEEAGQPDGQDEDHWAQAVREIEGENGSGSDARIAQGGIDPAATATAPGGLGTGLQPGGIRPGAGPGAQLGSIGTGGGSTAGKPSGDLKR